MPKSGSDLLTFEAGFPLLLLLQATPAAAAAPLALLLAARE
jgi:hypothetical protein